MQPKRSGNRIFAILLLIIAVGASYAPAVRDGFVWDDTALVLRDPLIRSWRLLPEGFNHYLFVDATPSDFYRPIQRVTYTIEYALFAAKPGPYHLTNIGLQAVAAIALMLFAEALLEAFGCQSPNRRWIAFLTALVWGIHPVHTAAVVYVSGRADLLAALGGFTGCWLALRSSGRRRPSSALYMLGAGLAFLISSLSKETGLVFPVLMLFLLALSKQRRMLIWLSVVAVFVGVIYLSLRLPAEHDLVPQLSPATPVSVRPINAMRAVAGYAGLLVFPVNLHMERNVQEPFAKDLYTNTSTSAMSELQTLAGVAIIAIFLFAMVRAYRKDRLMFALLFSVALTYLPISGALRLNASMAEHWIYVPSAFLFLAVAVGLYPILTAANRSRVMLQTLSVVATIWVLFLGARTFLRTFDWKDQRTFLERTIAAGGNSARMLINLASLESGENHLELAKEYLNEALKKEPEEPFALIELAAIAIKQKDFQSAHELLGRTASLPAVSGQAQELMVILENKEEGRADLIRLRLASRARSSNWAIEKRYVKLLAETGATSAAIQELRNCLRTEWYRAESWQLLAQLLARTGHHEEAAEAMACADSYDVHLAARPAAL